MLYHFISLFEVSLLLFILSLILAASAEKNGQKSFLQHRWLVRLGDASYGLYMYQYGVCLFFLAVLAFFGLKDHSWMVAASLLSFFVCVVVSLLSFRYFEMPARRWISNL